MKHLLFLGLLFFSFHSKAFDNTVDEVEFDKKMRKLTMARGISLPDMNIKFDIFVSPDSILYEMPRLFIGGREAKCHACGDLPISVEYKNEELLCYCVKHYPASKPMISCPAVRDNVIPPMPEPDNL